MLAELDGNIVGCVALIKSKSHGKDFLEIHSIAVHPNFRGKRVGTRLVKYLLTTIVDQCCDLYVRTTAPIFFEKLNFKKIENSEKLSLWEDCENCEHFEKCTQHALKYSCKHWIFSSIVKFQFPNLNINLYINYYYLFFQKNREIRVFFHILSFCSIDQLLAELIPDFDKLRKSEKDFNSILYRDIISITLTIIANNWNFN